MAIWQFELTPVPGACAVISGVPAIRLRPEALDDVALQISGSEQEQLFAQISEMLPEAERWSDSVKAWGDSKRDDVQIFLGERGVEAVIIRIDVRNVDTDFIEATHALARAFGWVFLGEQEAVIQPSRHAVLRAIRHSTARRYVENPRSYLETVARQRDLSA